MLDYFIAVLFRYYLLTLFDYIINKFNHLPCLRADHVIMMILTSHLEYCMAAFKVMTQNQPRRLKLSKYAVYGGQAHIITLIEEPLIHILGAQMMVLGVFQDVEDLHSRQSYLETDFS